MANGQRSAGTMEYVGLLAGLAVFVGPALAWLRVVPALVGFYTFMLGGIVSVVAGLTALINSARGRGFGFGRTLAILAAMVFGFAAFGAGNASMINDFTTNLDDPPTFRNAATLPGNAGRDLAYPVAFAETQRACCADLHPVRLDSAPPETLRRAEQVAGGMPHWTVTKVDADAGTIEAIAESVVFGFRDDIVIRVRPDRDGSVVDVRSKSRQGRGDMGANAARIRAYVATLEQPSTPPG